MSDKQSFVLSSEQAHAQLTRVAAENFFSLSDINTAAVLEALTHHNLSDAELVALLEDPLFSERVRPPLKKAS